MRAILSTFGFGEDITPLLALAVELRQAGHQPLLAFPSGGMDRARRLGIECVALGAVAIAQSRTLDLTGDHLLIPLEDRLAILAEICSGLIRLGAGSDVLIGSPFDLACRAVQDQLGAPFVSLHVSPFTELNGQAFELSRILLNEYQSAAALKSMEIPFSPDGSAQDLALYAVSRHVFDRPGAWASHRKIVGFLGEARPPQPPFESAELCAESGPSVVVALSNGVSARVEQNISAAIRQVRCKAVFSQMERDQPVLLPWLGGEKTVLDSLNPWLLKRADMVIHQGGAAASACTFCAGVPALLVPGTAEQKSWAELARVKGCTRNVIPSSVLSAQRLAAAIQGTLASLETREAAALLAGQIQAENGAAAARLAIEDLVNRRRVVEVSGRFAPARSVDGMHPGVAASQPVDRDTEIPLSFAQQRLWLIDQLEGGGAGYNMAFALRLSGEMNHAAMRYGVTEIVRRHEILRTIFPAHNGLPVQKILEEVDVVLEETDMKGIEDQEHEVEIMLQKEMERPFELARGPLLRMKLLLLGHHDHVLLGSMHHIVSDGWSVGIMLKELSQFYRSFCDHRLPKMLPLRIQYADFAVWQRQWLQGEVLREQLNYWKKQLADIPALELPADHPRPPAMSYRGGSVQWIIAGQTVRQLKQLGRGLGLTPFMCLVAVVQVTLSKYTGQEDVAVGTPIANRNRKDLEDLIGCFVNTLVLRTGLAGNPGFGELLERIRKMSADAYRYQDVPFERLVQELQPERNLTRTSFFQVMLALHNLDSGRLDLPGLRMTRYFSIPERIKFDLMLDLVEWRDGRIVGDVSYALDLYEEDTVLRLVSHLDVVLDEMLSDLRRRIFDFSLLTAKERQQILFAWNRTGNAFQNRSVQRLFEEQVARNPHAVAVAHQGVEVTYAELNRRANRVAGCLRAQGGRPGEIVVLMLRRSINFVAGMIAVWKTGGAYFPVDGAHPPARWQQLIEQSGARFMVVESSWGEAIGEVIERIPSHRRPSVLNLDQALKDEAGPESLISFPGSDRDLAYVIYTSGSTGVPKGAMVEQGGLVNHLYAMIRELQLGPRDCMAQTASQSFDISVWQFVVLLLLGGRTEIISDDSVHNPSALWGLIREKAITVVELVPSLLISLTRVIEKSASADRENHCLRWFLVTGEEVTPQACRDWIAACPRTGLLNAYGPAECSDDVTLHEVTALSKDLGERVPIGRPVANLKVYILDRYLLPVPVGVIGELYVGGIGVGRGYLGDVSRTAEAFLPDALSREDGGRLYKTGDLGRYRRDGMIEYLGRRDHQVKVRGYRIELGEVEAALAACAAVQAGVVQVAGESSSDKRLVGYVVLECDANGRKPALKALRNHLRSRLPEYMVPAVIVELERLPLTENGKVDRKSLPKVEAQRACDYVRPRTPTEEMLALTWSGILKVEKVGAQDHFFDLGGHSLLGTQLMSRLQETFRIDIPLRRLFEHPTLEELARVIDGGLDSSSSAAIQAIPRRSREEKRKLSYAQQRLWFLHQLDPASASYNVAAAVKLAGTLDAGALEQSMNALLARHEVLRARFVMGADATPEQEVMERMRIDLTLREVAGSSVEEKRRRAGELGREEAQRPFDLYTGPLIRAQLLRITSQEHIALLTMHHIVSDGWSMGVLVEEIGVLYQACSQGVEPRLEELPIQYGDYAAWQREWLAGEVLEQQLAYWKKQLDGMNEVLELPHDHARPAVQTYRGAHYGIRLENALVWKLQGVARRSNVTVFMLLMAAFHTLLWRYTGQSDIAVGTPIANRRRAEIEKLIGFFVNTLVVRLKLRKEDSFLKLLGDVREVTLGGYAHQDVPFERLVEELKPQRDLSRSPLIQVLFALQNVPRVEMKLADLELSLLAGELGASKFDLSLKLEEDENGIAGGWEYSTDLFEKETVARMSGHWLELLCRIADCPERPLADLPVLSSAERDLIAHEWNQTKFEHTPATVVDMFEEQAARMPGMDAVACAGRRLSYAQLSQQSGRVANYLRAMNVGVEARVGLCLDRSIEMVVGLLGILKSGGAYVPLDPAYPQERLNYMLEHSGASVLITSGAILDRWQGSQVPAICMDRDWETIERASSGNPSGKLERESLAYVIYTSGSTGRPKGVAITHAGLSNYVRAVSRRLEIESGWSWGWASTVAADLGNTMLFPALCGGGVLHVLGAEVAQDGVALAEYADSQGIDCLKITPTHLQNLIGSSRGRDVVPRKRLVLGGEASNWEWIRKLQGAARCGAIWNHYGPTETTVGVTMYRVPERTESAREKWGVVPIGTPLANSFIYILDEDMEAVPVGVAGELYIGGEGLARGYLGRGDLTAERFVPNPYGEKPGERVYRTGDRARWLADREVEFMGRADAQVKLRGFRVELGEIEAVLTELAEIRQSVVVVHEHAGERRLVAYIVCREGMEVEEERLRSQLRAKLPEYMVPAVFVQLEAMPLTGNGKLDRRALPEPSGGIRKEAGAAPRTVTEEVLAAIWAGVLHLDQVGVNENFFDLGGHSLLATQAMARTREIFQIELRLQCLFDQPTVAELAGAIENALKAGPPEKRPRVARQPRVEKIPLSYAQQRLWFIAQLAPADVAYNIARALRIRGSLDVDALQKTMAEIVRRHDVLRTRFVAEEGDPRQVVDVQVGAMLLLDLSGAEDPEAEAARLQEEEARTAFNLSKGPLLRMKLLRLAEKHHLLLLTLHHIVSDAWSAGILVREMSQLYAALKEGKPSPLPELPVQYADFSVWQREWLKGRALEAEMEYWRKQLGGLSILNLPADRPRPPVRRRRGAATGFSLDRDLVRRLRALGRTEGATLYMVLLSVFQVFLHRYCGQDDIAVGSPISGRMQVETEGLIGCFINTLVFRTEVRAEESYRKLLQRVRKTALEAYVHQEVPFEKLVEELQPERGSNQTPLFQVMFVFQNAPAPQIELGDVRLHAFDVDSGTAKFDLMLVLEEAGDEIRGSFEYDTDLFAITSVKRMTDHYRVLLEGVLAGPDCRVSSLPLLTHSERTRMLSEWNATSVEISTGAFFPRIFEEQAARIPDRTAVVDGDRQFTYRQLNRQANRMAAFLTRQGVGSEVVVALLMGRSIELLTSILAIWKAGGAYLPLDPGYPVLRQCQLLEESRATFVLSSRRLMAGLGETLARNTASCESVKMFCVEELALADEPADDPLPPVSGGNLAYVIYTSGSTGKPRGVMVEHAGMLNHLYVKVRDLSLHSEDKVAETASQCFDISVWQFFAAFIVGGETVIVPEAATMDSAALLEYVAARRITVVEIVPSLLRAGLEEMDAGNGRAMDLRALRWIVLTGEALSPELVGRWLAHYPAIPVLNAYGPTECSDDVTHHAIFQAAELDTGYTPIGRPVSNARLYVLDSELEPVPVGVPGELYVGGICVGRGYLNDAAGTALSFIPDLFGNGETLRLYRTGDRVRRLPGGDIVFLGRIDHQVKIHGFRVELGEIESALEAHASVLHAAVAVQEEHGGSTLVAYVQPRNPDFSIQELRSALKARLPEYMVPAMLMELERMPLTANGKLDRKALPRVKVGRKNDYQTPRTAIEEALARIWTDLLKLPRISVYESFFDLGGHSLLATRLIARISRDFRAEISLAEFFSGPTIAELAVFLQAREPRPGAMEKIATILNKVAKLSSQEIKSALEEKKVAAPAVRRQ